jgi:hypothetical protein
VIFKENETERGKEVQSEKNKLEGSYGKIESSYENSGKI